MGSGHILIAMFDVLMDIYKSTGYSEKEAAFSIIENNIHGLDIDKRAYQLSYFAVMMKGRGYNRRFFRGRDGKIMQPKVYAFAESNGIDRNHLKFLGSELNENEKKTALNQVASLIQSMLDARELGSVINVEKYAWELLVRFLNKTSVEEQYNIETIGIEETQNKVKDLIGIGKILAGKYWICSTNPPYMGGNGMSSLLSNYLKDNYPDSKVDLYSVFIEKCDRFLLPYGLKAMITQHGWMFLSSFEKLRHIQLSTDIINMAHLGPRAFDEISGEVVQTTAFVTCKKNISSYIGRYKRLLEGTSEKDKEKMYLSSENEFVSSKEQFEQIPGHPIAYWFSPQFIEVFKESTLATIAKPRQGLATGDNERFLRFWPEVEFDNIGFNCKNREEARQTGKKWFPCNKGGSYRKWYGNNDYLVNWENDGYEIKHNFDENGRLKSRPQNIDFYFQEGMTWSTIASGDLAMRYSPQGHMFETKGSVCFPNDNGQLMYLLGLMNTPIISAILAVLSPTLDFHEGPIGKVPVIIDKGEMNRISSLVKECVALEKDDWDSYETSWDFNAHPLVELKNRNGDVFIEDVWADWKKVCSERFNVIKQNEETINECFIKLYGLQGEVTSEVNDRSIVIGRAEPQKDVKSLISYAVGCMLGRYSINQKGLIYAGGEFDVMKYEDVSPDDDNIIPITDDEYFSDDIVGKLIDWIREVYGESTLESNLDYIANVLSNRGNSSREVIRNYFLSDFFKDHCNVYSVSGSGKRPIYWLFDSGKQNGFKCLIYMHRYTPDTVGIIRTEYLHKTQKAIEQAMLTATRIMENSDKASEKSQATRRIAKYTKQLEEIRQYDEAMAHVANRRIEIDLDDGVKVNYAKFQGIEVAQEGKKAQKIDLLAKI